MTTRWTPEDLANYHAGRTLRLPTPKVNKYRNKKTEIDGIVFDSKREATRYQDLKVMEQYGLITGLTLQPEYPLIVNGVKICNYKADFLYFENGQKITEDTKGIKTPAYRLKKKLMLAIYGIAVRET